MPKQVLLFVPDTILVQVIPDEDLEGFGNCLLDGEILNITVSQQVSNRSAEFGWGYCGSGVAQLALSILMQYLPIPLALDHFQEFKFEIVSKWPKAGGTFAVALGDWVIDKMSSETIVLEDGQ